MNSSRPPSSRPNAPSGLSRTNNDTTPPNSLTVTDMRTSTFDRLPPDKRGQMDFQISFSPRRYGNNSSLLLQLKEAIATAMSITNAFEIANADMKRLDSSMVDLLTHNDSVVLLDQNQVSFPIPYKRVVNATPHALTIINQEGTFHGTKDHNRAAFAIAELVDNALSATIKNKKGGRRVIDIRLYDHGKNSSLAVLDNGCGMNAETIKTSLRYKAPKDERQMPEEDILPASVEERCKEADEEIHPMYINSCISKFGAGMKHAVFWLGGQTTILTKTEGSGCVSEVVFSKKAMLDKEKASQGGGTESAWEMSIITGQVGVVRETDPTKSPSPILKRIIEAEETTKPSFTHIFIEGLFDGGDDSPLTLLQRAPYTEGGPSIERQLAHIYHYYLHGRPGNTEVKTHDTGLDVTVSRFDSRGNPTSVINLRDIDYPSLDLESLSVRHSTSEPYMFTMQATQFNTSATVKETVTVGGIIRYHPFKYHEETNPFLTIAKGSSASSNGGDGSHSGDSEEGAEEMNEPSSQTSSMSSPAELFQVWWNGRLIPRTRLEAFSWCTHTPSPRTNKELFKYYPRVSGSLFFNAQICEITENKLQLTTTSKIKDLFDGAKTHTQQSLFQRIVEKNGGLRTERISTEVGKSNVAMEYVKKNFEKWLSDSNKKFDKEVKYSKLQRSNDVTRTPLETRIGSSNYYHYSSAKWESFVLKAGNAVRLINKLGSKTATSVVSTIPTTRPSALSKASRSVTASTPPPVLGRVKCFYVNKELSSSSNSSFSPAESLHAPEFLFQVEYKPAPYYGDAGLTRLSMSEIDKQTTPEDAEMMIQEQLEQLRLKLEIHLDPSDLEDGFQVPITGTLFNSCRIHVLKESDGRSVQGTLPVYKNNRLKRNIHLVGRIYKIVESGKWVLYHTMGICGYWSGKGANATGIPGYYFKKLPFRSIENTGIGVGNHVLVFLSYVEVNSVQNGSNEASSPAPPSPNPPVARSVAVNSPRRSPAAAAVPRRTRSLGPASNQGEEGPEGDDHPVGEIDWKSYHWSKDVDSLIRPDGSTFTGRKILRDGDVEIRMPVAQIKFSIFAGPPKKFDIEDLLDESETLQRVGQPFNMTLSLKDSKGNATAPEDSTWFTSQKLKISFVKTKREPNLQLTLNGGECRVVENKLLIQNIIVEGFLSGEKYKDAAVEIEMEMAKGEIVKSVSPYKYRFQAGPPSKIDCKEDSIVIQNGSKPKLTCNVLDSSGNIVFLHQTTEDDNSKPVLFTCTIQKGNGEGDLVCTGQILPSKNQDSKAMNESILLPELQSSDRNAPPITLFCKVSYEEFPDIQPAHDVITVTRSERPTMIKLYRLPEAGGIPEEVLEESDIVQNIGENVSLFFQLFDGAGNKVEFDQGKHKVKCGWAKKERITQEALPIYQIPTKTETKEFTTKLRILHYEEKFHHTFYLTSKPGDPSRLHAAFVGVGDRAVLPLGTPCPDILIQVIDKHGNVIPGEQLDPHDVEIALDEGFMWGDEKPEIVPDANSEQSFVIKNLNIANSVGGHLPLGDLKLNVTFQQDLLRVILTLTTVSGPPKKLWFEVVGASTDPNGISTVQNNSTVRLQAGFLDEGRYRTAAPADTKISFSRISRKGNVILAAEIPSRDVVLKQGKTLADFGTITVGINPSSSPISQTSQCGSQSCTDKCFGKPISVQIQATTMTGKTLTERMHFHLTARSDMPAFLAPSHNEPSSGEFSYVAGSTFAYLTVTLEAEDGSTYQSAKVEHLYLQLTLGTAPSLKILASHVQDGVYTFDKVPTQAGVYSTEFIYNNASKNVRISKPFEHLKVFPDDITSLQPAVEVSNLIVSNDPSNAKNREIIPASTLALKDQFGNPMEVDGICKEIPSGSLKLSLSEGVYLENQIPASFPLINGRVELPPFSVRAGLDLLNNSKHRVRFIAELANGSSFDYKLDFTFVNNVEQQEKIQGHQMQLRRLVLQVDEHQRRLGEVQEELGKLQWDHGSLCNKTDGFKRELGNLYPGIMAGVNTSADVTRQETHLRTVETRLRTESRGRNSNIGQGHGAGEPDVYGPIGLMAEIKSGGRGLSADSQLQDVLSWHLQNKLGVVVTQTKAKGLELRRRHPDAQFMLLEITKDYAPRNDNLERVSPVGNPVYAHSLLQLSPNCPDAARKVFNKILGNTILMDNLESATSFMETYNRRSQSSCPMILTLDGHRVAPDGIIGGSGNSMPQNTGNMRKLGISPPRELAAIGPQLVALAELKNAMDDSERFHRDNTGRMTQLQGTAAGIETEILKCVSDRDGIQRELDALKLENTGIGMNRATSSEPRLTRRTRNSSPVAAEEPPKRSRRSNV